MGQLNLLTNTNSTIWQEAEQQLLFQLGTTNVSIHELLSYRFNKSSSNTQFQLGLLSRKRNARYQSLHQDEEAHQEFGQSGSPESIDLEAQTPITESSNLDTSATGSFSNTSAKSQSSDDISLQEVAPEPVKVAQD